MPFIRDWGALIAALLAIIAGVVAFTNLSIDVNTIKANLKAIDFVDLKHRVGVNENNVRNIDSEGESNASKLRDLEYRVGVNENNVRNIDINRFKTEFKDEIAKLQHNTISSLEVLPVGSIVPSMIEPSKFITAKLVNYFLPCDGREIPKKSNYFKIIGNMNVSEHNKLWIPDLRGKFIRGLNVFDKEKKDKDDGKLDPDSRRAGDYQEDTFQGHHHQLHYHRQGKDGTADLIGTLSAFNTQRSHNAVGAAVTDNKNGKPRPSIETRPKNVAVYYYIKIN